MTDEKMRMASNVRKLMIAGIAPRYIGPGRGKEEKLVDRDKVPFSSYHTTYSEFMKDRDKLLDDASEGKDLDDTILLRVSKTIEELGISN